MPYSLFAHLLHLLVLCNLIVISLLVYLTHWSCKSFNRGSFTQSEQDVGTVSAVAMDLHTDIADFEVKENILDQLIENCKAELKQLTEDSEIANYPFIFLLS